MITRRQKTEDREQGLVCRYTAYPQNLRGLGSDRLLAATHPQSSILALRSSKGFTLIEMIMVMVITGIIGGMIAMFIRAPVQGYLDSARRAAMTDIADTALRRVSRDLRLALPNSVRVATAGTNFYLEFIPTIGGGRYRTGPPGDPLDFSSADGAFDVLAPVTSVAIAATNRIAIYNLGIAGASVYAGDNFNVVNTVSAGVNADETHVTLAAPIRYPFASPGNRFHVFATPVTYVCAPAAGGGGTLTRYWGYALQAVQPSNIAAAPLLAADRAQLATNVGTVGAGGCSFSYQSNVVAERTGIVTMNLTITQGGESVTLYNVAHVSNEP